MAKRDEWIPGAGRTTDWDMRLIRFIHLFLSMLDSVRVPMYVKMKESHIHRQLTSAPISEGTAMMAQSG